MIMKKWLALVLVLWAPTPSRAADDGWSRKEEISHLLESSRVLRASMQGAQAQAPSGTEGPSIVVGKQAYKHWASDSDFEKARENARSSCREKAGNEPIGTPRVFNASRGDSRWIEAVQLCGPGTSEEMKGHRFTLTVESGMFEGDDSAAAKDYHKMVEGQLAANCRIHARRDGDAEIQNGDHLHVVPDGAVFTLVGVCKFVDPPR